MSQQELADRTGLSRTAITMIESGQRNPTLFVCHALALALKVPLSVVIHNEERVEALIKRPGKRLLTS